MIAHTEANKRTKAIRAKGVIERFEYEQRAYEFAKRGEDLPQTKLTRSQVDFIRAAKEKREAMRKEINDTLSNKALAEQFGVHYRTIEKVLSYETHVF